MDDILARLLPLFRDVLGDASVTITPASNAASIPGYDSLAHINIISAVEQEFDVRFELKDILELDDAGDLITLIQRKLSAAA